MKNNLLFIVMVCLFAGQAKAQAPKTKPVNPNFDTVAVSILDRMSELIGELSSCSAIVHSNYDVSSKEFGLVKHSDVEHVYIGGADKLLIRSEGDKGTRNMAYDGKTLSYYSVDKNQYSDVKAPASVMDMIDYMHKNYGITFPMADFLYPTFVDDILAEADNLQLLGMTKVGDKDCFHIAGTAKDKTFQFWISDDAYYLPMKMVIVNTSKPLNPQYEATYTDWQVNPNLPASIFEFKAPPKAKKIKLTPLTVKK